MKKTFVFLWLFVCYLGIPVLAQWKSDTLEIEGKRRPYLYFAPKNISENAKTLMVLHGSDQTAKDMADISGSLVDLATTNGILLIFPSAYKGFWNECRKAGSSPAKSENVDDIRYFKEILKRLEEKFKLSSGKSYLFGFSGGGQMAYKVALTAPKTFTAYAILAATLPDSTNTTCTAKKQAVHLMAIHGTKDNICPYQGGQVKLNDKDFGKVLSAENSIFYWSGLAGYSATQPPYFENINGNYKGNVGLYARFSWDAPNQKNVRFIKAHDSGHEFPAFIDVYKEIWSFFGQCN